MAQIEALNQDCVKISRPYLEYFSRNMPSRASCQFIVLNYFAGPKIPLKMYFHFFKDFKTVRISSNTHI